MIIQLNDAPTVRLFPLPFDGSSRGARRYPLYPPTLEALYPMEPPAAWPTAPARSEALAFHTPIARVSS